MQRLHHRGVYAVGHRVVGRDGRWLAAVLACGEGALLSHRSADALWDLRASESGRIEVTVPYGSGVRRVRGVNVHRTCRPDPGTTKCGIPVTSTRAAFERDRARDAALTAAGWRVVRFTHRQVLRGGAGPGLDRLTASPAGSAPARG